MGAHLATFPWCADFHCMATDPVQAGTTLRAASSFNGPVSRRMRARGSVRRTVPVKTMIAHFHSGMPGSGGGCKSPTLRRAIAQTSGLLSMMLLTDVQTPRQHTRSMGLQFASIFHDFNQHRVKANDLSPQESTLTLSHNSRVKTSMMVRPARAGRGSIISCAAHSLRVASAKPYDSISGKFGMEESRKEGFASGTREMR